MVKRAFYRKAFTLVELLVVIGIITVLAALLLPALRNAMDSARKVDCMSRMKQIHMGFSYYLDDNNGYFPPSYYKFSTITFAGYTRTDSWVPWYSKVFVGNYIGNSTICSSSFPTWQQKVTSKLLACPTYKKPKWDGIGYSGFGDFGFGYNQWAYKNYSTGKVTPIRSVPIPTMTFLMIDTALGYEVKHTYANPSADKWSRYWWPDYRHLEKANILFMAGNVRSTYSLSHEISDHDIIREIK
ncbi:MAG: prepilin-type N-terminal cleavage/methylation domain-containing protein [Planctomycetes bacterium]|nr:prepilin-type N-terminal cleavage/methylation domain-containing protein [Planctomycetota bacterium]